jgi:hypothetical protein
MLICTRFSFATIEPPVDEFGEEVFEDFEDNQGQATQGKPSILVAYLDPSFTYASFFKLCFMQSALFLIAITPL